ncbi:MAG TPA: DNA polymerase III subunit gamma/tau [Pirellulales bacterium]|nr:DNA polymerase III subunit gamma/tau [Pirellulales bacterium]
MPEPSLQSALPVASPARPGEYIVVARRYRPQTFAELVGQEHVAQALEGAINSQRVGHAYLFTGARGVGKTSAARILAKALNCVQGPTPTPCNQCDICQAISSGDDVDVLEIDGASNRGIDEMRELRQNVNVRPSRARFKIYIIDEVHMLTKEAFNALLKTLEEPPEHVKFIFCTTEPEKIPTTILSRCQPFQFAGIELASIAARLRQIVEAEGVEAEPPALNALARRAAGSMRDSQSLLEQLLSFSGQRITLADVQAMLGTAGDRRLSLLAGHLVERDAAAALSELDTALAEGVDIGPLLDQLLGYFRDLMVAAVGCPASSLLYASPSEQEAVLAAGGKLGLETVLAIMQILDQTIARLRYSSHGRILAELALVRICKMADLEQLAELVGQLRDGAALAARSPTTAVGTLAVRPETPAARPDTLAARPEASMPPKKKSDSPVNVKEMPAPPPCEPRQGTPLTTESLDQVWGQALTQLSGMFADSLRHNERIAISAPNRVAVAFPARYTSCKTFCERAEQRFKLEKALETICGQKVRVEFTVLNDVPADGGAAPVAKPKFATVRDRLNEKAEHPLVRRTVELFAARPVKVEEPET